MTDIQGLAKESYLKILYHEYDYMSKDANCLFNSGFTKLGLHFGAFTNCQSWQLQFESVLLVVQMLSVRASMTPLI